MGKRGADKRGSNRGGIINKPFWIPLSLPLFPQSMHSSLSLSLNTDLVKMYGDGWQTEAPISAPSLGAAVIKVGDHPLDVGQLFVQVLTALLLFVVVGALLQGNRTHTLSASTPRNTAPTPCGKPSCHFHGSLLHTNGLLWGRSMHDQFDYIRVLPEISV